MISASQLEAVIRWLARYGIKMPPDTTARYLPEELYELAKAEGADQQPQQERTLSLLGDMRRRLKGRVTPADAKWISDRAKKQSRGR